MQRAIVGGWQLDMPRRFLRIDNEDSVQFADGNTVIFVSELLLRQAEGTERLGAKQLHEKVRARMNAEYELDEDGQFGYGSLTRSGEVLHFTASREGDGSVLNFVATLAEGDVDHALKIWRSARYLPQPSSKADRSERTN